MSDLMTYLDLRALRRIALDVNLNPFSWWCWKGWCEFAPGECLVPCDCECHEEAT
jgi:hypothetical protein